MTRCSIVACAAALCAVLSGCTALDAALYGVDEPDVTRIVAGQTRKQAEHIVGKPVWRVGTEHGLTYDIYQYQAAAPGMYDAGQYYGAGYATLAYLFFWPVIELWDQEQRTHLRWSKQIAIGYDTEDIVRFVSVPWDVPEHAIGAARRMRALIPPDAGVPRSARAVTPEDVRGASPEEATLVLRPPSYIGVLINGEQPRGRRITLPPGRRRLELRLRPGASRAITDPITLETTNALREVEFLAGRLYTLRHRSFRPYLQFAGEVVWIEDGATGEAIDAVRVVPNAE